MSRHRRRRVGLFVGRRTYLDLLDRYQALLEDYRSLTGDHQAVLEDHEELLYGMETGSQPVVVPPVPGTAHTPSWALTEPVPVITEVGLEPDKAEALVRRADLLEGPSGSWSVEGPETG